MFDVIVVGLGAWGASTTATLSKAGLKVLGIDQFSHPHPHGSSHASTRVYREADSGGTMYVPFAVDSLPRFQELETEFGVKLFERTGGAYINDADSKVHAETIQGYLEFNRDFEELTAAEVSRRWPALQPPAERVAIYEHAAGAVFAENIVSVYHQAATKAGAQLSFGETVLEWSETADHIKVVTDRGEYEAEQLVLCLGPWLGEKANLDIPIIIERQVPVWYDTTKEADLRGLPIFVSPAKPPAENIYVIPDVLGEGAKATMHRGGLRTDRLSLSPDATDDDLGVVDRNLQTISPLMAKQKITKSLVCRYTNAPDLHWILSRHPASDRVVVIGADGGRGMKFAPFIGDAALSLVRRETRVDLLPFDAARFHQADVTTRIHF